MRDSLRAVWHLQLSALKIPKSPFFEAAISLYIFISLSPSSLAEVAVLPQERDLLQPPPRHRSCSGPVSGEDRYLFQQLPSSQAPASARLITKQLPDWHRRGAGAC